MGMRGHGLLHRGIRLHIIRRLRPLTILRQDTRLRIIRVAADSRVGIPGSQVGEDTGSLVVGMVAVAGGGNGWRPEGLTPLWLDGSLGWMAVWAR